MAETKKTRGAGRAIEAAAKRIGSAAKPQTEKRRPPSAAKSRAKPATPPNKPDDKVPV